MNQPDFSIYLIFLFGFGVPLLVLPAAYYLRRHWSLQKRLAMAPFLFVVGTILYAALIGANYRKPGNGALAYIFGALWLTRASWCFMCGEDEPGRAACGSGKRGADRTTWTHFSGRGC